MSLSESFSLKLDRAREHLQIFEDEARTWIETKPYGIVDEPDPNPPPHPFNQVTTIHRRFRMTRVDPVPARLSLIVEDCVFNIRSALDHLALALAKSFTPNMTDRQIATSEFPVFHLATLDPNTESRKIGCIAPAARTIIKALQPYHRGNSYHSDPLWRVHELNRIDKHRMLTICATAPRKDNVDYVGLRVVRVRPGISPIGLRYAITGSGMLEVDKILMRYGTEIGYPYDENDTEPHIPCEVTFGNGGPAALESVFPSLNSMCDFVRDAVIGPLSQFL